MKLVSSIIGMIIPAAYADGLETACTLIGGCQPVNVALNLAAPVVQVLISVIAGVSMLFVMYGGGMMLISMGDDSKYTTAKNSIIYALVGFGIAIVSQSVVAFVVVQSGAAVGTMVAGSGFGGFENPALALINVAINSMLYLFNGVFAAVIIFAGFRLVLGRGKSEELEGAKKMLIYAVMGALIINLAKALVTALLNLAMLTAI